MEQMLIDSEQVYYVIKVNGNVVSQPFTERMVAEMQKSQMPAETQLLAEIVPVTSDGRQVLFG